MTLNVTSCRRKRQIDESVKSAEMRKDPVKEAGKEREGEDRARGPEKGGSGGGGAVYSVFLYDVYMSFAYCFILLFIPVGCNVCNRQIHLSSLISLSSSV